MSEQHPTPELRIPLRGAPAELDGMHTTGTRYVALYENQFGEQLVFVWDQGRRGPVLYHSDNDWDPVSVSPRDGTNELVLSGAEALWLGSCLAACGHG